MSNFKVKFLLDDKEVEVAEGTTLLEAAEQADIFSNSLCGGKGLCGECCLPDIETGKIQFIGNSSIMGARMALLSTPHR